MGYEEIIINGGKVNKANEVKNLLDLQNQQSETIADGLIHYNFIDKKPTLVSRNGVPIRIGALPSDDDF